MERPLVHERISQRHPDISTDDVVTAWNSVIASSYRVDSGGDVIVAIGIDGRGRALELVARVLAGGDILIYHAMTPPTRKVITEVTERR